MTRSRIAQAATLALLAALLLASSSYAAAPQTSATAIEKQAMCVTCKIPLQEANSPQAEREKEFIKSLVAEGKTEGQIKAALVAEYGPAVLSLPKASGVNLAVYIVPPVIVLLALAGVLVALPRWRKRGREQPGGFGAPVRPLSPTDSARLEDDMARFRG